MASSPSVACSFEAGDVWIDFPSEGEKLEPVQTASCSDETAASTSDDERHHDRIDIENLDPASDAFRNVQAHHRDRLRTSHKRPGATCDTSSVTAEAVLGDCHVENGSRGSPRRKVKSPLPDNYPRIPLNDITSVLYGDSNIPQIDSAKRKSKVSAGDIEKLPFGPGGMSKGDAKTPAGTLESSNHSTKSAGDPSKQRTSGKRGERNGVERGSGRVQKRPQPSSSRNVLAMR